MWYFLAAIAVVRAGHLEERDPYWQVRAGMENLAGVPLARPDTWSWAPVGGDWYPNSPAWNLLLGAAYSAAGFAGFFLAAAVSLGLLLGLVKVLSDRLGARPLPGLVGLLAAFAASFPMLSVRATSIVQTVLLASVLFAVVWAGAAARRTHAVNGLVVTLVAGVASVGGNWIHLSFLLLGPGLAVVWAVVWWLWPGLDRPRRWVMTLGVLAGWCAGPLLSPYGVSGGLERTREVQRACEGLITEWSSPLDPRNGVQSVLMLAAALVLAAGAAWFAVRRLRAGRRDPVTVAVVALGLIGVPAAIAGVLALRFVGVALLTLAPFAGLAATRLIDRLRAADLSRLPGWLSGRLRSYSDGGFWRVVLAATGVVLLPGIILLGSQLGRPPENAAATRLPSGCQLFSTPGTAGSVVLLRADVRIWMDGRADYFGRERLELAYEYFAGTRAEIVPPGATCLILDTGTALERTLRSRLASSPQWRPAAREGRFELWLPAG